MTVNQSTRVQHTDPAWLGMHLIATVGLLLWELRLGNIFAGEEEVFAEEEEFFVEKEEIFAEEKEVFAENEEI